MISFCQDLSISYQYHIYENKTIKKITHKRNGSNISEKTFTKSSKLSVVSKNKEQLNFSNSSQEVRKVEDNKTSPQAETSKVTHKRSTSNYLQERSNIFPPSKVLPRQINNKETNTLEVKEPRQIEFPQPTFQSKVYFTKPNDFSTHCNKNVQEKNKHNEAAHKIHLAQPINYSRPEIKVTFGKNRPFQNTQSLQSRTIKFKQSFQKLNQSIETKNYHDNGANIIHSRNHKHSNSFASDKTTIKPFNHVTTSSMIQQDSLMETNFYKQRQFNFFTPKENFMKNSVENELLMNSQRVKIFQRVQKPQFFGSHQTGRKLIIPEINFPFQNDPKSQTSFLFDTQSIVSQDFDEQQDEDGTSVVEQRNFFFEKQEQPQKLFKKSIDKFLFLEPGYISHNQKWIFYRNVKEKENKKFYSIKEFSIEQEKQYFNEYDIYLALKAQTSHFMCQTKGNNFFLNLFNALSKNQGKKLHLVKDSFNFTLNDYINHLKKTCIMSLQKQDIVLRQKQRIESEIQKIFEFFSSKGIQVLSSEQLQIQDFVVCQGQARENSIKFHSLQKLEKSQNDTRKFHKLKHNKQLTQNHNETFKGIAKKQKLYQLFKKINLALLF